jgi:4a-hydroxytetrahydrobiopterin dehydratase
VFAQEAPVNLQTLAHLDIEAVRATSPAVVEPDLAGYRQAVPDWNVVDRTGMPALERAYRFKNFEQALAFTNRVGALAEAANHHPAILTEWGRVTVTWWTHVIRNLHRNDFILAARCDEAFGEAKP